MSKLHLTEKQILRKLDPLVIGVNGKEYYRSQPRQTEFHSLIEDRERNGLREFFYGGAAKGGKGLYLSSPILTHEGWKTMKDIKVGDYVIGSNGKYVKVIWESGEYMADKCFEIEFDNDEKVICDAPHLWRVRDIRNREKILRLSDEYRERRRKNRKSRAKENPKKPSSQINVTKSNHEREYVYLDAGLGEVKTTEEMFLDFNKRGRNNYSIDTIAFQGTHLETDLDPYLLGMWTGDGTSTNGQIGMLESDINECLTHLPNVAIRNRYYPKKYKQPFCTVTFDDLRNQLIEYGILGDKRIPEPYMNASYEQRVALLQGIMDTDGHCNGKGQCEIGLSKKDLAEDLKQLIASLGIKCTQHIKRLSLKNPKHNDSYTIKFTPPIHVFRLVRKRNKQKIDTNGRSSRIYIKNIKEVPPTLVKCIQVENPDGMYLITKSNIPTHNSHALRFEGHHQCLTNAGIRGLILRSSFPELEKTHLLRIHTDLPRGLFEYNESKRRIKYEGGSYLMFGYGERLSDFGQYLGAEYDFIMVDEMTTIPFEFTLLLKSRLAASIDNYIPFFAGASNPGSQSHSEIKSYFIDKDFDIIYPEMATVYDPSLISFTKATVYDNHILMERDPEIVKRLMSLRPRERKRFLEGSWDIFEGQYFEEFSTEIHVLKDFIIPQDWKKVIAMDYGNVSTCIAIARDPNGDYVAFAEWTEHKKTGGQKAISLKGWMIENGFAAFSGGKNIFQVPIFADTNIFARQMEYGGIASVNYFTNPEIGLQISPVQKRSKTDDTFRIYCNEYMKNLLHFQIDRNGMFVRRPKFYIMRDRCPQLLKTLPALQIDPKDDRLIADSNIKHWYDAAVYALVSFDRNPEASDENKRIQQKLLDRYAELRAG